MLFRVVPLLRPVTQADLSPPCTQAVIHNWHGPEPWPWPYLSVQLLQLPHHRLHLAEGGGRGGGKGAE